MGERQIETPHGPAAARVEVGSGTGTLMLGHGAGGGVEAPDLAVAASAAGELGMTTVLVTQPYRVAGRRAPAPARQLDAAWVAVARALRAELPTPLVAGGRSLGARVACRTAAEVEAAAVLCLAFPVHPPGKGDDPSKSRVSELDAVSLPVLVVQGRSDPFGMPQPGPRREVIAVAGNHGLKSDLEAVRGAVDGWLRGLLAG